MSDAAENPFRGIGAPPQGTDPEPQLAYLRRVVDAFHSTGNPRLRPLRQKLDDALEELARGAAKNLDPEKLAREFGARVTDLRLQTFDLLLTVINQVRATLRVKLQRGMPWSEKIDTEKLQQALGLFSQGLRKTLAAARKADPQAHDEGNKLLEEAGRMMAGVDRSQSPTA
ncbi:MAG: hypothetical protein HY903_23715 [Deltaproteobacteria bacterium]|nr:hypothetical protein [Deltaproteobacteria bacterium]